MCTFIATTMCERDLFKYIFIQLIPYFCPKIKAIFDLLLHVQALLTTFVPKYYYSYLLHSSNMYFRHKSISCLVIFRLERKLLSSVCVRYLLNFCSLVTMETDIIFERLFVIFCKNDRNSI